MIKEYIIKLPAKLLVEKNSEGVIIDKRIAPDINYDTTSIVALNNAEYELINDVYMSTARLLIDDSDIDSILNDNPTWSLVQ